MTRQEKIQDLKLSITQLRSLNNEVMGCALPVLKTQLGEMKNEVIPFESLYQYLNKSAEEQDTLYEIYRAQFDDICQRMLGETKQGFLIEKSNYAMAAAQLGFEALGIHFLEKTPDINQRNGKGATCLMYAITGSLLNMVNWLIEHQVDPSGEYDDCCITPLTWAIERGKTKILEALLKYEKTDVTLLNSQGDSALKFARKKKRCVEMFLAAHVRQFVRELLAAPDDNQALMKIVQKHSEAGMQFTGKMIRDHIFELIKTEKNLEKIKRLLNPENNALALYIEHQDAMCDSTIKIDLENKWNAWETYLNIDKSYTPGKTLYTQWKAVAKEPMVEKLEVVQKSATAVGFHQSL